MSGSIVLMVEGDGDQSAVPILVRRILHENGIYNVQVAARPAKVGDVAKLSRPGELERHLRYAELKEGSAMFLVQDCDDGCAANILNDYLHRAQQMRPAIRKPFNAALLVKEFETLLLYSVEKLASEFGDYGWRLANFEQDRNWESVRDAKGELRKLFRAGQAYKELRDQPRLASGIDVQRLRSSSRSFRHLESSLLALAKTCIHRR